MGGYEGYGIWIMDYGLWVMGYGLWVTGYGLGVTGYGLMVTEGKGLRRVKGYVLRSTCLALSDDGYGIRGIRDTRDTRDTGYGVRG